METYRRKGSFVQTVPEGQESVTAGRVAGTGAEDLHLEL